MAAPRVKPSSLPSAQQNIGLGSDAPYEKENTQSQKPLAVSVARACELMSIGPTSMWAMIKSGRVATISIGRRRLVIYASLEKLITQNSGCAAR